MEIDIRLRILDENLEVNPELKISLNSPFEFLRRFHIGGSIRIAKHPQFGIDSWILVDHNLLGAYSVNYSLILNKMKFLIQTPYIENPTTILFEWGSNRRNSVAGTKGELSIKLMLDQNRIFSIQYGIMNDPSNAAILFLIHNNQINRLTDGERLLLKKWILYNFCTWLQDIGLMNFSLIFNLT